ncbi:hypothetical protein KEU06_16600 [Pseudaminobacter sp. 19-2017]|uniref:Uncharacterized protein n=1 Tax=Pseudaminobacter soli (ex Zhang et al. 2022) TaxID=2831468 RepID=A0A942E448_9HYPH|nr:hypothetical protein [Pseudaminobacter soli]MBS3650235.1 hypothetical protein [Pseudaminobacter soli]
MPSLHPAAVPFDPTALLTLLILLSAPLHSMTAAHLAPALFASAPALVTLLISLCTRLHCMPAAHLPAALFASAPALVTLLTSLCTRLHCMTAAHLPAALFRARRFFAALATLPLHLAAALLALRRPASASAALGLVRRLLPGHFGLGHGKSGRDAEGQCKRALDQDLSHGRFPHGLGKPNFGQKILVPSRLERESFASTDTRAAHAE